METHCLFCKIRDKLVPATVVYEDSSVLAFEDINPQAPVHVLIIPRRHIDSLNELTEAEETLVGHLHCVATKIARERQLAGIGWRTVINCGQGAGQSVFHLHVHLMGGRSLRWPPG